MPFTISVSATVSPETPPPTAVFFTPNRFTPVKRKFHSKRQLFVLYGPPPRAPAGRPLRQEPPPAPLLHQPLGLKGLQRTINPGLVRLAVGVGPACRGRLMQTSSRLPRQWRAPLVDEPPDVIGPSLQRCTLLVGEFVSLIDANDAGERPGYVVQNLFDHR